MFVIILMLIFQPSFEECLGRKVSINIDLVEDAISVPLDAYSEKLLWHVGILQQEETGIKFLCSGTIVGTHHVLTAASCVVNVGINELRVVSGLRLLRRTSNVLVNPHSLFTVTKKYYNHLRGDLSILKLENEASFKAPQLSTLDTAMKYSKQCFTLGWGIHNQSSQTSRCYNPIFKDSINNMYHYGDQNKPILNKILEVRNFMGFSSMFTYRLSKVLDFLPGLQFYKPNSKHPPQDSMCSVDEFTRGKAVRMTTKHPYKCLCRNTSRICLYSAATDDIAQQIDIGSPVFCKLKNPKASSTSSQTTSTFALAGIMTNKKTEEVRWLKYKSPIKMMTSLNVTMFTDFIIAVMFDKS